MSGIRDTLESEKSTGSGDFADWWDPDEGDKLVGIVGEKHGYNGPGGSGEPVPTVISIGSSVPEGDAVSLRGYHAGLSDFAESVQVCDVVLVEYQGMAKTDASKGSGNAMNVYAKSKVPMSDWSESDDADEIRDIAQSSPFFDGSFPETDGGVAAEMEEMSGGLSTGDDTTDDSHDGTIDNEVRNHVADLLDVNGGEMSIDDLDEHLNQLRNYDVDPETSAEMAGFTVGDGTVTE